MESIVRFVLLEMGMAKQEYLLADMETILKEMLYIYTPVGPE